VVFKIAHLSDLHLGPLPRVKLMQLMSKRLLGYASWLRGRRRYHRPEALEAVVEDLGVLQVDHTVITGDLVNIALPDEFSAAARWLRAFGTPESVTVVPGNHDAYVASAAGAWSSWGGYMGGQGDGAKVEWPFVKEAGPVSFVGLSTAVPTPAGFASGILGDAQLRGLGDRLQALRDLERIRVVLLHHPPIEGWSKRRKALRDADRFRQVVERFGADLILCGHEHRLMIGALDGPDGEVPVFCAPSASLSVNRGGRTGGYLVYTFDRSEHGQTLLAEHRVLDEATGYITTHLSSSFERGARAKRRNGNRVA
jgi:3',5'-cyclic AMP phosphodiesterase CpdA